MIDRREQVNLAVIALLAAVPGIKGVFRDRGELPPQELTPGIVYLDGTERIKTQIEGRNFVGMPTAVFTMRPQIFLVLTMRTDASNTLLPDGTVLPVGVELSSFRVAIINAVVHDESLIALVGPNGSIVYEGHDTDMQTGSTIGSLGATMQFHFAISYVLDPTELF
jgi:hypothetical protein